MAEKRHFGPISAIFGQIEEFLPINTDSDTFSRFSKKILPLLDICCFLLWKSKKNHFSAHNSKNRVRSLG
jgi:hypothetical protein